ncbi:gamma-glutamyl-gamma-aminobutyrate hydrolase family protein [Pseudogracilibacillus sp. SE30717A]|uniref:gamma-glutamyl-gamma-aminobutyrate hydrolase family protein n=1 Tax=Pseudogracilibacillus sp. SE30717A TaxID=3098293 RepID=UPI00300E1770
MNPVIGITPSINEDSHTYFVNIDNMNAIVQSGGTPIILPLIASTNNINQIADMIDGLYLTGGNDIDPTLFNEEPHPKLGRINPARDEYEIALTKKMIEQNKPVLGVCRGSQILNIALGGTMYQDIYSQKEGELLQHQQNAPADHSSHYIHVAENSLLSRLVGKDKIKVNSRHHQANDKLGSALTVSGTASDGVIEAIEGDSETFVLGLQWHPENLINKGDESSKNIYAGFIQACKSK